MLKTNLQTFKELLNSSHLFQTPCRVILTNIINIKLLLLVDSLLPCALTNQPAIKELCIHDVKGKEKWLPLITFQKRGHKLKYLFKLK